MNFTEIAETRQSCRKYNCERPVEEDKLREVLELYYIDVFSWEQVAQRMGYKDVRWVQELHGRALYKVRVPECVLEKMGTSL